VGIGVIVMERVRNQRLTVTECTECTRRCTTNMYSEPSHNIVNRHQIECDVDEECYVLSSDEECGSEAGVNDFALMKRLVIAGQADFDAFGEEAEL
jgi:hypothetical protein